MGSSESMTDQASTLTAMDNLGALQEDQTEMKIPLVKELAVSIPIAVNTVTLG